ncbi:MAG: TIGR01212 family radical SAM protein [Oscillospiraceae bacterium]|nr:TIGR01212 family radical SAM protein [Oscillospiraceae bacterium]
MYLNLLNDRLKEAYGVKVYKLALSSGCSCPNRDGTLGTRGCIFCDGAGAFAASGGIGEQMEDAKARLRGKIKGQAKYIAYFQSFTNTYGDIGRLEALFSAAMEGEEVVALSVATRPDCLGQEVLAMLERLGRRKPVWVELGLQTIHPATAAYIRRGYGLEVYDRAVEDLHAAGAEVVVHQILGLPGETAADMAETARYIGKSGAEGIKFHLLHVLRGTDLAAEYRAGKFEVMTPEAYIAALEECVRSIPREMVIHRLTGDGAKRDLVAPLWSGDKKRVLNAIHASFARHDVEQGSAYRP